MAKFYVVNEIKKLNDGLLHVKSDIYNDSGAYVSTVDDKVIDGNEKDTVIAHLTAVKDELALQATATECHLATNSGNLVNVLRTVYSRLNDKDPDYAAVWDSFQMSNRPITSFSKIIVK